MSFITIAKAKEMIGRYKAVKGDILNNEFPPDALPVCETFSRTELEILFEDTDCSSFRIYYAMDEENRLKSLMVGVDAENADMLTGFGERILMSDARCPDECPPDSPVNS